MNSESGLQGKSFVFSSVDYFENSSPEFQDLVFFIYVYIQIWKFRKYYSFKNCVLFLNHLIFLRRPSQISSRGWFFIGLFILKWEIGFLKDYMLI